MITIDTGTNELLCVLEDGVATVTLNKPDKRNALGDILTPALRSILLTLEADERCGAILLTGAGRAFCAGGDVSGMGSNRGKERRSAEGAADRRRSRGRPDPEAGNPDPADGGAGQAHRRRPARARGWRRTLHRARRRPAGHGRRHLRHHRVSQHRPVGRLRVELVPDPAGRAGGGEGTADDGTPHPGRGVPAARDRQPDRAVRGSGRHGARPGAGAGQRTQERAPLHEAEREPGGAGRLRESLSAEAEGMVRSVRTADHREAVRAFMEKRAPRFGQ